MSLRRWLKRRRIKAVTPSPATRTVPFPLNRKACKRRNLIERPWGRLMTRRRIATRHDRCADLLLSARASAPIILFWL